MRNDQQNIKSKHYKEMRAIRKENVQLVGTIEEKLKLVGMIECNLRSEMARHLKSIYDNDQLLARTSQKYKLRNESLRDKYKLLNESLHKYKLLNELLRDQYKLLYDENEKLKIEMKDQLKSNNHNKLLLDTTRYDLNVSKLLLIIVMFELNL